MHKTRVCDGRWIDISTMSKRQWLCIECRAIRTTAPESYVEEEYDAELEAQSERRSTIGVVILVMVVIIVAMSGIAFTGWLMAGGR